MDYAQTFERFLDRVRRRRQEGTQAVFIIDSPWLPGYAGVHTLDFYFEPEAWLHAYRRARDDLPGAAFVPGAWVEFGMAAEPSGWGVPVQWHPDGPPSIRPRAGGLEALAETAVPDPERDGLMPVILRRYERMKPALEAEGMAPRMAAARGPLAVAAHLLGVTEILMATHLEPEKTLALVEKTTDLCIRWLRAQLARMKDPVGILVLDDVAGMMGPEDAARFAWPHLARIFAAFPDMIRVYHNDTPNRSMLEGLARVGMDVFNFSHEIPLREAREKLGEEVVLMGNLPPLDLLVRGSREEVGRAARAFLAEARDLGPVLISPGGGVSPGTPVENLRVLVEAAEGA